MPEKNSEISLKAGSVLTLAATLAATNTGVGTGSTLTGWVIQQFGFRAAFGTAAALAAMSVLYFILVDRRLRQPGCATC